MVVRIDPDEFPLSGARRGNLVQHGVEYLARLAPRRPEGDQNGPILLQDFRIEVSFANINPWFAILVRIHSFQLISFQQ
jgi:hypothetical protein